MTTSVKKWGNSLGVRIPAGLAREVRLEEGSPVRIESGSGRIIITPIPTPRYSIKDLARKIRPRNRHRAVDTGRPVGNEVW